VVHGRACERLGSPRCGTPVGFTNSIALEIGQIHAPDRIYEPYGVALAPSQTTVQAPKQGFCRATCSGSGCRTVSAGVARRRGESRVPQMCPECVRMFNGRTTTKCRFAGTLRKPSDGLEPSTPSLPWRFRGVTRVHARSFATRFLLQIGLLQVVEMCRETSRVSFLMCPFCVRALMPSEATHLMRRPLASARGRARRGAAAA
jgi:hypothetical protein